MRLTRLRQMLPTRHCSVHCCLHRIACGVGTGGIVTSWASLMQRALGPGRRDSAMDSALHLYRKLYNLLYTNLMYNPCTPALTADIQPIQLTLIVTGGLHTMQPIQYTARIHYAGYTVYSTIHHPSDDYTTVVSALTTVYS